MIQLQRQDDLSPVCPHCKNEISSLWYHELSGFLGKRFLYFCSNCKAVLGISHRKGFWMG